MQYLLLIYRSEAELGKMDAAARKQVSDTALATVEQLGGALRRTFTAIEPYLMQLDLERR